MQAARRLAKRAFRARERRFLAEGPQAVREALTLPGGVVEVFATRAAAERHADSLRAADEAGVEVHIVSGEVMSALCQTVTPQGLVAVCAFLDRPLADVLAPAPRLVTVLADARDPGNAGTVIRTADAAGSGAVVLAGASVDPYNGKCVRASAGSLFHLPVTVDVPVEAALPILRAAGLLVLAADGHGSRDLDAAIDGGLLDRPTAWVFGNEAWGLPAATRALADEVVRIPIHGRAESLNLAAAAAVCLYASARAHRTASDWSSAPKSVVSTGAWGADRHRPARGAGVTDTSVEHIAYDDLPDGLVVADRNGRVVVFNRAAARMTGIDAEATLGRTLDDALPLEGLDGRPWWPWASPYTCLRTVTGHPERNLVLPGGIELLVSSRYLRDPPGGPIARVVVALRDTRHRAREELGRAELVSTVAHELRSPLTSVKGFTATLLAKWDRFNDDQKRLMLETVHADADRVTRLITELLDISRIDSGRLTVSRQVVDLRAVVGRHIAGMVASGEDPARFDVQVTGDGPQMWLDADKIDQVVANLLENAVRHGGGRVTVLIEGTATGTSVTVTDQGEGISAEQRDRVFTRFWRSGRRGGTGLGLYIVRGLVEAHGGHIAVGAAPGGGALFRFVLPAGTPDFLD